MKYPRFIKEYAGFVNGCTIGTENPDFYGARLRKTLASLERGYITVEDAAKIITLVLSDIQDEKSYQ